MVYSKLYHAHTLEREEFYIQYCETPHTYTIEPDDLSSVGPTWDLVRHLNGAKLEGATQAPLSST